MLRLSRRRCLYGVIAVVVATSPWSALAQTLADSASVRLRGRITSVRGRTLSIHTRDGRDVTVDLSDDARVMALVRAARTDIKAGSYIGITAMPLPDGGERAIAIHIFTEAQRGVGEGHRPWDLQPGSTMTNATVETVPALGMEGDRLSVTYKGAARTFLVPPDTAIVAYVPGERSELVPGAEVIVARAMAQPGGGYRADAISVGRGVTPPM